MSELSLKLLRDAGLSPDWMTVYLGWLGFGADYRWIRLGSAEVQDFGYERIGLGTPDENYAALRLIDLDLRKTSLQHEERCLRELAGKSPGTPELARRKWRLAHWAGYWPGFAKVAAALASGQDYDEEEIFSTEWIIGEYVPLWSNQVSHPPLPQSVTNWGMLGDIQALRQAVGDMERWTTTERAAIRAEEARTP